MIFYLNYAFDKAGVLNMTWVNYNMGDKWARQALKIQLEGLPSPTDLCTRLKGAQ